MRDGKVYFELLAVNDVGDVRQLAIHGRVRDRRDDEHGRLPRGCRASYLLAASLSTGEARGWRLRVRQVDRARCGRVVVEEFRRFAGSSAA